jgi:Ca-activated chloride channel family protein
LSDVPAAALSPAQIASLGAYVRDLGGGLVLLGGDRGMGPGGYGHTAVEEVSPVSFDLKQEERRASLAEVIAIDTSGSMGAKVGGLTKLELANEAAVRAARLLGPADRLGVLHVDTEVHRTVPLGALGNMASLDKAIRSMPVGGGGIIVPIALEGRVRGARQGPNQPAPRAAALGRRRRRGHRASPVPRGRREGQGHHDHRDRARAWQGPHGARGAHEARRRSLLPDRGRLSPAGGVRSGDHPGHAQRAGRRAVQGRSHDPGAADRWHRFSAAPELAGYVVTLPKPRATVHLAALDGDPLLATWSVGLGRAAVFTSDLKDRWGSAWTAWAPSARLIAQLARDVARRPEDDRVRLEARATGGKLEVRATAVRRGRGDPLRALRATIAGPGGTSREVELEPTSVGTTYEASVPLDRAGAYVRRRSRRGHRASDRHQRRGPFGGRRAAPHGERPRPPSRGLSAFTGGVTRTSLELVFRDRAAARRAYDDITARIAMLAALLLLTAVAARKLGMPEVLARARERLATRLREPAPMQPARATSATVGSLLTVKRAGNLAGRARTPDPAAEPRPPAVAGLPTPPPPGPRPAGASPGRLVPRAAPPDRPPPPEGPAAPPPDPGARPRSTAELLVARRKAKK